MFVLVTKVDNLLDSRIVEGNFQIGTDFQIVSLTLDRKEMWINLDAVNVVRDIIKINCWSEDGFNMEAVVWLDFGLEEEDL